MGGVNDPTEAEKLAQEERFGELLLAAMDACPPYCPNTMLLLMCACSSCEAEVKADLVRMTH